MDAGYQYELVRSSREVLFNFCATISNTDFVTENSSFGRGSIRNLLVHIGNTYEFWLGRHGLKLDRPFTEYAMITDPLQAKAYFLTIDELVAQFVEVYSGRWLEDLALVNNGRHFTVTPLKLFTHVITHEFHHKGQVLSLSRHLGYVPVDTDIIR